MPRIFELFGFPLTDKSEQAEQHRRAAHCPYMNAPCDGGGNRYLSMVQLDSAPREVQDYFPTRSTVHAGVCSIQPHPSTAPWIVCPRRLLHLGADTRYQAVMHRHLLDLAAFPPDQRVGVWPEVKVVYHDPDDVGSFDYTFDYVLMPLTDVALEDYAARFSITEAELRAKLKRLGYRDSNQNGVTYVHDVPWGSPFIIEVMTSSTSGGNTTKRTTIPLAFQDAIMGYPHQAPGINKRQVWARMASQLIVKSEVALAWGGRTVWVVQDTLIEYIAATTALNVHHFAATQPDEVTLLAYGYHPQDWQATTLVELTAGAVYAGPIQSGTGEPSFQDIIRARMLPPVSVLLDKLLQRPPTRVIPSHTR